MAKGFQGYKEHNIDKTPSPKSGGKFQGMNEDNLEPCTKKAAGSSAEAAPGYPKPSKKEGGGKGVW